MDSIPEPLPWPMDLGRTPSDAIDIDGDGNLDLVGTNPLDHGEIVVQLGDGALGFGPPIVTAVDPGTDMRGAEFGDVDGNGILDAVGGVYITTTPGIGDYQPTTSP